MYGNSWLKYTEGGDKTSQYLYLVIILSNWVPDNWVYRLPSKRHTHTQCVTQKKTSKRAHPCKTCKPPGLKNRKSNPLAGLETQSQNAAFSERKRPERKPWPRGKSLNRKKTIAMRFWNASVLERKALNRNLSWGFPLGNLLPKTRVLKHRVLERKRRPNANASVLGTQRFRTLRRGTSSNHFHCAVPRSSSHIGPPK